MLAAARRINSSSSSHGSHSSSSSSSSTSTKCRRPVIASLLGRGRSLGNGLSRFRKKTQEATSASTPSDTVPIDTVRKLLMGYLDPIDLARQILPPSDLAAVVRYNSAPYRPPLDLKNHAIATAEDVLFVGLTYVGFDGKRQNIRDYMNVERFCSHYKLCPEAIFDAWNYFQENSDEVIEFQDLLISLNFLKSYDTEHILAGRWRKDEDTIRSHNWKTLRKIQYHRMALIYFDPSEWHESQIHIVTVDTVDYTVEEQRSDLVGKLERWYDHKSHSAGVKYEMALPLCLRRQTCVWSRGPFPAGDPLVAHDGCFFRGGSLKKPKSEWDKNSLYFQIPDGKKAIGDSLYAGMPDKCTVALNGHNKVTRDLINLAKAREERYHGHTKEFNVLKYRFRHGSSADDMLSKHKLCVDSIHILLHFDLQHRPLMDFP